MKWEEGPERGRREEGEKWRMGRNGGRRKLEEGEEREDGEEEEEAEVEEVGEREGEG